MLFGQPHEVEIHIAFEQDRYRFGPQAVALFGLRHGEGNDRLEAAGERVIDIAAQIGRQDDDAGKVLDALQEVADFLIGVAIVGAVDAGTLAKQGIGLIEEQDPAALFGQVEDAGQILFRFADVFRHDHRQVNAMYLTIAQLAEQAGRQRLAGAWWPMKQAGVARTHAGRHAQRMQQGLAVFQPVAHFFQMRQRRRRQHQIGPVEAGGHALGRQGIGLAPRRLEAE